MIDHDHAGLLDEARRLAATGPVSPAGRIAYRAAAAAVPGPPGAVVAALLRLAEQDRDLALHALAAAQRAATDAAIEVSGVMVTLAAIRLMLHRLAHSNRRRLPAS